MRYREFQVCFDLFEGRKWQETDDVKLLNSQINSLDNDHAVNVYGPDVQITDAVKCIAIKPECKWFFDLLTTKLHKLSASSVDSVDFYLYRYENEWVIWAVDANVFPYVYDYKKDSSFPFSAISLHAENQRGVWYVSLIDVLEYEKE